MEVKGASQGHVDLEACWRYCPVIDYSRDIVYEQCPRCPSVVAASDGPEGLLARRVPDLQLDALVRDVDHAGAKLDADRQVVYRLEPVARERVNFEGTSPPARGS